MSPLPGPGSAAYPAGAGRRTRRPAGPPHPGGRGPATGTTRGRGSAPGVGARPGAPAAGRHRRRRSPRGAVLFSVVAVLALLLGGGGAVALTGLSTPPPTSGDGADTAALGTAPATDETTTTTPATTPTTRPGAPTAAADPRQASPDPADQPATGPRRGDDDRPARSDDRAGGEPADDLTALEDEVTALTNEERAAAGCDPVSTDERLRDAARGHSADMAANDYFSHDSPDGRDPFDRMEAAGYPAPAGENIAYGYPTPADVVAGWMNSDGHRRNILTCSHRATGVGLAYDASGTPYWTQVFGG